MHLQKIYKYVLRHGLNQFVEPVGQWLSATIDPQGKIVAYALVSDGFKTGAHKIQVAMTGEELMFPMTQFLGTVSPEPGVRAHVMLVSEPPRSAP